MKKSSGVGGFISAVIIILGILLGTGVIGPTTGLIGKMLHLAGIALAVVGVIIALIVIGVIVAAVSSSKETEDNKTRRQVNESISGQQQQLSRAKGSMRLLQVDLKRVTDKIAGINENIQKCEAEAKKCLEAGDEAGATKALTEKQRLIKTREPLLEQEAEFNHTLENMQAMIDKAAGNVQELEDRRASAYAKMKTADAKNRANEIHDELAGLASKYDDDSLSELEEKAQYERDYAAALKELNEGNRMQY